MAKHVPLALFAGMEAPRQPDGDPDLYPGSKTTRRAVSGVSNDPWEHQPHVEMTHNGAPRKFYGVGVLAKMLGREAQTIRKWEKAGYIPRAAFRYPGASSANNRREGQRRLYTREQIEGIVRIAYATGVVTNGPGKTKNVGTSGFPQQVRDLFTELKGA